MAFKHYNYLKLLKILILITLILALFNACSNSNEKDNIATGTKPLDTIHEDNEVKTSKDKVKDKTKDIGSYEKLDDKSSGSDNNSDLDQDFLLEDDKPNIKITDRKALETHEINLLNRNKLKVEYLDCKVIKDINDMTEEQKTGMRGDDGYIVEIDKFPKNKVFILLSFRLLLHGGEGDESIVTNMLTYSKYSNSDKYIEGDYFVYFSDHPKKHLIDGHNYHMIRMSQDKPREIELGAFIPKSWLKDKSPQMNIFLRSGELHLADQEPKPDKVYSIELPSD